METSNKTNRKVKIHKADIPEDKTEQVVARLNEAMDKYTIEKDMATFVKKKCDEEFGGTWHCVIDQMHVLLFKSLE